MKKYYQYAYDVIAGKIVAGDLIKMSCQRFLDDLKRDDLVFYEDKADKAISFIEMLKHFTGKSAGQRFILEPWQCFITANLTGFYWKESGLRRFTNGYIETSRKQGKTAYASAMAMYYFLADGEPGAEVDFASNSKEQAKIAFSFASQYARQLDPKQRDLKIYRDRILLDANASSMRVFASDDSKLDGFNASCCILDEYHSAKNSKVKDVIKSSMGMRENPMMLTITTAGFDKDGPCYKMRSTCVEVLHKFKTDDSLFIGIWCIDSKDSWKNPDVWPKCQPNLNKTVTVKYIQEQVQSAINNPQEEVGTRTKVINEWCDSAETWLPDSELNKCRQKIDLEIFRGEYIYGGVDLSSVSDLTSLSLACWKESEQKYYFWNRYYLPADSIKGPNAEMYKEWQRNKELIVTPGNVCDYNYIIKDLLELEKTYGFRLWQVNYDQWNATQWAISATESGININPQSQSIGNFNKPTKELERLIRSCQCVIDSAEPNLFCFRNVQLRYDINNNCKPDKKDSLNRKIDGVIAMIMALYASMENHTGYYKSWSI